MSNALRLTATPVLDAGTYVGRRRPLRVVSVLPSPMRMFVAPVVWEPPHQPPTGRVVGIDVLVNNVPLGRSMLPEEEWSRYDEHDFIRFDWDEQPLAILTTRSMLMEWL